MSDHQSTLENLREGSDEFQRALTRLNGVTEEDAFETLTDEEIEALNEQLPEQNNQTPEFNNKLDRIAHEPVAVLHSAYIELPDDWRQNTTE